MNKNQRKIGVVISYLGQFVQIITGIVYTPIMLRLLGQSEYGLYQLVYSVVSYLSLLSLGFSSSYMRFYSREKVAGKEEEIAKLNGMFMIIFGIISIVCIFCGIVMIVNIDLIFGTGLSEYEYKIARILMELMVLNLALTFPNSVFNCIVTSQECFLFQKMLILLQNILNPFLALPLLIMGYGSIGMVSITTGLTFAVLLSNFYYCIKKLNAKFVFSGLRFSLLKEMWVFTFFIFINQIVDQINWSVDKFLLGRMAGTTAVAVYGVGGQINALYLQLSTSVSNVFIPKVNKIVAQSDDDRELTNIFTKVGRIQFIIMSLILTGLFFFGQPFIKYWAGEGYQDSYFITLLLVTPATVPLIQNIGVEIQRAKNKHKVRSLVYLLIALANIVISIPLIKIKGPIGAAIGTTLSLFVGNVIFMNWYYHSKLGINIVYFWKNIGQLLSGCIIPLIFGLMCMEFFEYDNVWKLLIGIIIYGGVFCGSMFLVGMNQDEKSMILNPIKKVVKNE